MSEGFKKCPIWREEAIFYPAPAGSSGSNLHIYSSRAGGFYNIDSFYTDKNLHLDKLRKIDRRCLSYWIWKENLEKSISADTPYENWPTIIGSKLEEMKRFSHPTIEERIQNIVLCMFNDADSFLTRQIVDITLSRGILHGGDLNTFASMMASSFCDNDEEFIYLVKNLIEEGFLEKESITEKYDTTFLRLTLKGHRLAEQVKYKYSPSANAFVAIWFNDKTDKLRKQGIKPAIEQAGYNPVFIDEANDIIGKIDNAVIAKIRGAKLVIADFTHDDEGARGSVYYEAGFAHGLDKLVIFCCRKDQIKDVHFDTQQYNHILWDEDKFEDFRKKLTEKIVATIGQGPLKVKNNGAP